MLLSECIGKARLMSSILILLGVSGLFQNRRYINICGDMQVKLFHIMPSKMHLLRADTLFSFQYRKVIGFASTTPYDWLKKLGTLFHLIRNIKLKLIVTSSHWCSRASRELHVITLVLGLPHSTENHSKTCCCCELMVKQIENKDTSGAVEAQLIALFKTHKEFWL